MALRRGLAGIQRKARALAAAVAAAAGLLAIEAQAQALKLAYVEFPPYSYTEGGIGRGDLLELFDKIAKEAGLAYVAEAAPAQRLVQGIADGDYNVILAAKSTPTPADAAVVSAAPIARIELNAYAIGAAPSVPDQKSLSGKSVVVLAGYAYEGWRAWLDDDANKVTLVEARTAEQALALLEAGRGEVLLHYAPPIDRALAAKPTPEVKAAPVAAQELHLVVSSKTPDAAAVLAKLEAGYAKAAR